MAGPEASQESAGREKLLAIRRRRRRARVLRGLAVLAVLGIAVVLWLRWDSLFGPSETEGAPSSTVPAEGVDEGSAPPRAAPAEPGSRPETEPGTAARAEREVPEPEPLPPLAESDAVLRAEADALSDAPAWSRWLGTPDLLERFVLSVVQVSEGSSPRKPLAPLAPTAPYRVRTDEDGRARPHPASAARYDEVAAVIAGIDAEAAAALYRRFEPLLDAVHARLGAPDTPLRDVLARAAAEILAAPRVVGDPALVFHVNHWRYADPALEGLSPLQKLVLRTGPANARRIQDKVRQVARALGMPARALPETPVHRVAPPGG